MTVYKNVTNDNGGALGPEAFTVHVKANGSDVPGSPAAGSSSPGTTYTLAPGVTYVVSEGTLPSGNEFVSFSGDCDSSGNVTVPAGTAKTCTITNTDQPASLTVIKHVINDNGGLKVAANFTIDVTGVNVSDASFPGEESPGTTITLDAGAYEVTETLPASYNYTKSFSADCSGTIANGQTKTCTVTNDDNANAVSVTTQQKVILHDRATISGILRHTNETTAKVKFRLYSDNTCTTEVGFEEVDANPAAGQTNVQVGTATGFTITLDANPGNSTTHRWWRAFYGGNNIPRGGVLNSPQETLCTEATSVTMSQ